MRNHDHPRYADLMRRLDRACDDQLCIDALEAIQELLAMPPRNAIVETDELVEKVARAIWGRSPYWTWDEGDEESQERCRVQARAAIRAMLSYAPSVPKSSEVQK